MPQRILGIDLGAWSAKAVLVETSFRGFEVISAREVRVAPPPRSSAAPEGTAGAEGGATAAERDPITAAQRQVDALRALVGGSAGAPLPGEAEPLAPLRADVYVVSFPGELATVRQVPLPFADTKRVEQTIGGELADLLPFEITDAVFDHAVVKRLEDGSSVSLCAATRKEDLAAFLGTVHAAGLDPKFLPVDAFQLHALYSHFLREDLSKAESPLQPVPEAGTFVAAVPGGPPDARLVVDIGHDRTVLCAASEEGIAYTRVIRAGGRDVTAAIARAYGIAFEDAEEGKHADALVASSRHPAPTDLAQRMSEVVAEGLSILVKELRRSLQAIRSEKKVRVARIDLVGGGSRIRNLANYLADQLNVPVANGVAVEQIVERQVEAARRPAYACALASALRAVGETPAAAIDLRVGEFQFAGQLQHLKQRAPVIAGSVAILLMLLAANTFAQYHVINKRERSIDQQFCDITKTVVGRPICEPAIALSVMKDPQTELGSFKLPERSAVRVAAELSGMIPEKLMKDEDVWINEFDINNERARVSGESASFDAVDQIVAEYAKDPCYAEIKKSRLRKKSDGKGVEFQLSMNLRCSG